ncbi:fukutin isoform X1 [Brachionus plicatilis]|uniref:Fukutin isoform X1 n=1 Tax=Brachionus plicatilis TaxID=10195 RepID=A0A3M7S5M4_BRAPC|nr:fukutin isoform X1 [Brachionus plicatilis]
MNFMKKFVFPFLGFLIFLIFFSSKKPKCELKIDEKIQDEYTEILGHLYSLGTIKNIFYSSISQALTPVSNNSEFEQTDFFTYGLEINRVLSFIKAFNLNALPCQMILTSSHSFNKTFPAAIYIKCVQFIVHIPIFYPRGNFFWIPCDNYQLNNRVKLFNDHQRALNKFHTKAVFENNQNFIIPVDFEKFIYDYNRSKFIDCNLDLAESKSFRKDYWLSAGTLLGWYRDCGIIPHTTDGDIGLLAEQYSPNFEKAFLNSDKVPMVKKLGFVNDSLEFRVGSEALPIDLFFNYIHNQTHMMYSIQAFRKVYRIFLTRKQNFCSAQLFEEKFFVPCEPDLMLDEIYGKNLWKNPDKTNKMSPNILLWKKWSLDEWKNAKFLCEWKPYSARLFFLLIKLHNLS